MNTQFYKTRLMMVALLLALLLSGCTPEGRTQATMAAVYEQARIATDGKIAAMGLVGSNSLQQAAPSLWAIQKSIANSPGAYMLFNDAQQVAIFLAPAGKDAAGTTYWYAGVVDTAHTALVDASRTLTNFGIDTTKFKTLDELKTALRERGFAELAPSAVPTLYAALRLGLGFLRSLGTSISHILVIPTFMLTPEQFYPWCDGDNCQQIKQ